MAVRNYSSGEESFHTLFFDLRTSIILIYLYIKALFFILCSDFAKKILHSNEQVLSKLKINSDNGPRKEILVLENKYYINVYNTR